MINISVLNLFKSVLVNDLQCPDFVMCTYTWQALLTESLFVIHGVYPFFIGEHTCPRTCHESMCGNFPACKAEDLSGSKKEKNTV